jgi:hypothetical protein
MVNHQGDFDKVFLHMLWIFKREGHFISKDLFRKDISVEEIEDVEKLKQVHSTLKSSYL